MVTKMPPLLLRLDGTDGAAEVSARAMAVARYWSGPHHSLTVEDSTPKR